MVLAFGVAFAGLSTGLSSAATIKLCLYSFCRLSWYGSLLLLPVTNRRADRILCEHRAVNLHGWQRQFLNDIRVLDGERFIHVLAFDPLGRQRGRRNRRSAAD